MLKNLKASFVNRFGAAVNTQEHRQRVWQSWYTHFDDNPFGVHPAEITRQTYLDLAAEVQGRAYPAFLEAVNAEFGFLPEKAFIDELALATQVVVKKSQLLYMHGYLLYDALRNYLHVHPELHAVNILETGTAGGFSALCMAKALADADRAGKIITLDVLHARKPLYWNYIHDTEGQQTRLQLLEPWQELLDHYVIFLRGCTDIALSQLEWPRVHFAFLDSGHDYTTLQMELAYVRARQQSGDVVVCDDYTPAHFPGVVRAVDEFLADGTYTGQPFMVDEQRGYMVMRKTK
jgi:hypothetical protein